MIYKKLNFKIFFVDIEDYNIDKKNFDFVDNFVVLVAHMVESNLKRVVVVVVVVMVVVMVVVVVVVLLYFNVEIDDGRHFVDVENFFFHYNF